MNELNEKSPKLIDVTIYLNSIGDLIIYSGNYLFDRRSARLYKDRCQNDIEEFMKILSDEEKLTIKNGWSIKTKIPYEYGEIYFE